VHKKFVESQGMSFPQWVNGAHFRMSWKRFHISLCMHSITMTLKNNHPKLNNSKLIEPTNPIMIIKTVMQNSAIQSSLNQPTPQTLLFNVQIMGRKRSPGYLNRSL
jgi:hypothetical protein